MKIRSVRRDNRRKGFAVRTARAPLWFPYGKLEVLPTARDPVVREHVDAELGREGFSYVLKSGREGTVHVEQVLESEVSKSVDMPCEREERCRSI